MDDHLVGRAATGESGCEAIEDGNEAGTASPLGLVEPAQSVKGLRHGLAAVRPMRHAFCREAVGGATEVPAEL